LFHFLDPINDYIVINHVTHTGNSAVDNNDEDFSIYNQEESFVSNKKQLLNTRLQNKNILRENTSFNTINSNSKY